MHGAAALVPALAVPAGVSAQQAATAVPALVFDGVTVVDMEQGKLRPGQRIVIAGNRIQAVGAAGAVKMPKGVQVVNARGKSLVPGLWDMHTHAARSTGLFHPMLLANGVTGIRDAGAARHAASMAGGDLGWHAGRPAAQVVDARGKYLIPGLELSNKRHRRATAEQRYREVVFSRSAGPWQAPLVVRSLFNRFTMTRPSAASVTRRASPSAFDLMGPPPAGSRGNARVGGRPEATVPGNREKLSWSARHRNTERGFMTARRFGFGAGLVGLLAGSLTAQGSNQAPRALLKTRWTTHVSAERVLSEYPRPSLVRPNWTSLNGRWDYAIRDSGAAAPLKYDGTILVPFPVESYLSGVQRPVAPRERLWYRRSFTKPKLAAGDRLLLHFGAVDWEAVVLVNGEEVGRHRGGYDPFSIDITDALLATPEQELVVRVWDATDGEPQVRGKQLRAAMDAPGAGGLFYTPSTGIWQTVWLEPVPRTSIRGLEISPDIDAGVARVLVLAAGAGPSEEVRIIARDSAGVVGRAAGKVGDTIAVPIPNARLWSPAQPSLYDLEIALGDGDKVRSYVGMRKIAVARDSAGVNRLFLNNKPYFQIGLLDQGWWPDGLYRAPTDDALRYDIEQAKRMGFNVLRKHMKVEPERWYYHADRLGLLVWQDMPPGELTTPASRAQFAEETHRIVAALRNHPSIVQWVVFNEGWSVHDMPRHVAWFKKHDPTRPVVNNSGWNVGALKDDGSGDVISFHYADPPPVEPNRVVVLGEYQNFGRKVAGHIWGEEAGRNPETSADEELSNAYRQWIETLRDFKAAKGLAAVIFTQLTDVEGELNGILTYDREVVKISEAALRQTATLYDR